MANRCAGLNPTCAHLPATAPAAAAHYCSSPAWLLTPAAAFENEALTSALRASMAVAPAHAAAAAASFSSSPATPSDSTSSASELLSSGSHDAPAPAPTRPGRRAVAAPGPKEGRVAKRRARPSRRAQTTYITADAANFRRMVQEITGLPVPGHSSPPSSSFSAAISEAATAAAHSWTPVPVLPTLDTSAFLFDRAAPADKRPTSGGYASTATDAAAAVAVAGEENDDPSMMLELEALVCAPAGSCSFPTLDLETWGIV